jgi:transposase-like protein
VTPFFSYPPEIRKVIYTTNAIESINASLRKVTKKRGAFPNRETVRKVMYLGPMDNPVIIRGPLSGGHSTPIAFAGRI